MGCRLEKHRDEIELFFLVVSFGLHDADVFMS